MNTIKPTLSNLVLSSFVAADAGSVEAQYDARISALYTAYRNALKDGQKTQLMLVRSACALYSTPKQARALTATPDKDSAAAKRAAITYRAYGAALKHVGVPGKQQGTIEEIEAQAESMAVQFVDIVMIELTPKPKAVRKEAPINTETFFADAEAGKAKMLAADAAKEAAKAQAKTVPAMSLDDMALCVANAMKAGLLSSEAHDMIISAAEEWTVGQELAETLLSTVVTEAEPEEAHA